MSNSELATGLGLFWISLFVAAVAAWPIYRMLLSLRSRQTIDEFAPSTHQVKQGTPTMGGLIILAGFIVAIGFRAFTYHPGSLIDSTDAKGYDHPPLELACLVLAILFALIGFADDFLIPRLKPGKRGLGWKQKIIPEIVFGAVGCWMFTDHKFNALFGVSLFLVLFFSNAYNFSDGLDALSGSLLIGICVGLGGLAWLDHNSAVFFLSLALVGAVVPFLIANAPPAKVFMGDVGSLPIGAVLGLLVTALAYRYPRPLWDADSAMTNVAPLATLSFIMLAELIPVPMQVAYYKLTKKRLFPMTPIHHAFEKKGWKETRVVWLFALVQLACSIAAITVYVATRDAP